MIHFPLSCLLKGPKGLHGWPEEEKRRQDPKSQPDKPGQGCNRREDHNRLLEEFKPGHGKGC